MQRSKVDHNTARSEAVDRQNPKAVDAMLEHWHDASKSEARDR